LRNDGFSPACECLNTDFECWRAGVHGLPGDLVAGQQIKIGLMHEFPYVLIATAALKHLGAPAELFKP